jgi:membrane protein DedA with SNARE-associated domain
MSLQSFIDSYGYIVILIGTFFEGETILVLGGIAAKLGHLQLPWVIVSAFAGSLLGDQLLFQLGRLRGPMILQRFPAWKKRSDTALSRLEKHRLSITLGFRFVYGMRTVTPFVLGMTRMPFLQFLMLNTLSAAAWAALIASLGFIFGHGLELIVGDIHHYEIAIFSLVVVGGLGIWLLRGLRRNGD